MVLTWGKASKKFNESVPFSGIMCTMKQYYISECIYNLYGDHNQIQENSLLPCVLVVLQFFMCPAGGETMYSLWAETLQWCVWQLWGEPLAVFHSLSGDHHAVQNLHRENLHNIYERLLGNLHFYITSYHLTGLCIPASSFWGLGSDNLEMWVVLPYIVVSRYWTEGIQNSGFVQEKVT